MAPPIPKLTPVTRGGVLIPVRMLAEQVQQCERFGTWCLAQALAEFELVGLVPKEDNRYHNARMQRLLAIGGAALGSINGRTTAFKFIEEVRSGRYAEGDPEAYERAR
jgi:hypothetical protein